MKLVKTATEKSPPRAYYRQKIRMYACAACGNRFRDAAFLPHPNGYPVSNKTCAVLALCGCGARVGFAELGAKGKTLPLDRAFWEKELRKIWFESLFTEIHGRVPPEFEEVKSALFSVAHSFLSPKERPLTWIDEVKVTLLGHCLMKVPYFSIPDSLASLRGFRIAFEEWEKMRGVSQ